MTPTLFPNSSLGTRWVSSGACEAPLHTRLLKNQFERDYTSSVRSVQIAGETKNLKIKEAYCQ